MVAFSKTARGTGACLLIAAGAVASLLPVYRTLSQTYDEPMHIACGMEWLDRGRYSYEAQHPPLARIADAIAPYWSGLRAYVRETGWEAGDDILYSRGTYRRNLTLARLGGIPFLLLACGVIFVWSRRWFSVGAGVAGVLLFCALPPVLAAASQATTDMACAATVALALYVFLRWIENPDVLHSILFGGALAVALLSKFSSIPFLIACIGVTFGYFALTSREWLIKDFRTRLRVVPITIAVALFLVWAGYRFSFHSISEERGYYHTLVDLSQQQSRAGRVLAEISMIPFPMPEFFHGLYMVARHNQAGYDSFLLGEYRDHGWWTFFPVLLAIKTPIGFILLSAAGAVIVISQIRRRTWHRRLTVFFPGAILLVCMASSINIGVRHVLPIYPLLAILGGYAVSKAFRNPAKWVTGAAAVLLAGWCIADVWLAKPDYIAYFNLLAGSHPERITIESDLGQDVGRLSETLREMGVNKISLKIETTGRLDQDGIPPFTELPAFQRVSGYVAISDRFLQMGYAENKSFAWLNYYAPIKRIGKTIWLYRIP